MFDTLDSLSYAFASYQRAGMVKLDGHVIHLTIALQYVLLYIVVQAQTRSNLLGTQVYIHAQLPRIVHIAFAIQKLFALW